MQNELAQTEAPAAPVVATPEPAAPVAAVVAPVTPAPVEIPVADQLVNLTPEGRRGLLFGHKSGPEPTAPATPVEAAPVVVATAVPAAEVVPPVVPPVDPEPEDDDKITRNFRLHTEDPRQSAFLKAYSAALRVNPNVNPADIARSVGLDTAPAGTPVVTQAIPGLAEAPQVPAEIVNARAEIAVMEAQIDEAVSNGELLTPAIAKLQRDYAIKQAGLAKIELRHELATERQAESAATKAQTTREDEMTKVEGENPSLLDNDSDLSLELDRQFGFVTSNPQHPDFQKVNAEGFPAYLVQKSVAEVVARKMKQNPGMTEAQATAAVKGSATPVAPSSPVAVPPARQTQTNPVPRTVLVTAPGGNSAPAPVTLSIEQVREEAARDPNFRRRALGFSDTRVVA